MSLSHVFFCGEICPAAPPRKKSGDGIRRRRHCPVPLHLAIGLCVLLGPTAVPSARAVTINLGYDAFQSRPPSIDPSGLQLQSMMTAAAAVWEDMVEDPWTLNVSFWWQDLSDDSGTLALELTTGTSGGKPTSARITFDTEVNGVERNWFLDPTPLDASEFALDTSLYRDLTVAKKIEGFTGNPPDLLEVNVTGSAKASAPLSARTGFDLYSVMLHELGHAVGMSPSLVGSETADGDYDILPQFLGGAASGARVESASNIAHLGAVGALMGPTFATGKRRLASSTDVLAVAASVDWLSVDLPRKDFLSGSTWNNAASWLGNQVPDGEDEVFVRHGGSIELAGLGTASQLTLADGAELITAGHDLAVSDTTRIDGTGAAPASQLVVSQGSQFTTSHLDVVAGGALQLAGGSVSATGDLRVDGGSTMAGFGSIEVDRFDQFGILNVTSPLSLSADATFFAGSMNTLASDVNFSGTAVVEQNAGVTGNGQLVVQDDGVLDMENGATLGVDLINGGLFRPGLLAGGVTLAGFTQLTGGTLQIELGGTAPGTQFDQIHAAGSVVLGGELEVSLIDPFVPQLQSEFEIIDVDGALVGNFDGLPSDGDLVAVFDSLGLFIEYHGGDGNDVVLYTLALPQFGDLNCDGTVDFDDIDAFVLGLTDPADYEATFGAPATLKGDMNEDGRFDFDDIDPFVNLLSASAHAWSKAVPEPSSTGILMVIGLLGLHALRGKFLRPTKMRGRSR